MMQWCPKAWDASLRRVKLLVQEVAGAGRWFSVDYGNSSVMHWCPFKASATGEWSLFPKAMVRSPRDASLLRGDLARRQCGGRRSVVCHRLWQPSPMIQSELPLC